MLFKAISPTLIVSLRKLVPSFVILAGLVSSCITAPPSAPGAGDGEPPQAAATASFTPTEQVSMSTPTQTVVNDTTELFSSDPLGLCFSYPQEYTQNPYSDTVQLAAHALPGSDVGGLFWLEVSDSYNRTAEKIADQDMTYAAGMDVGRWTVMLGGEQAVVLDGMPGQELQRRVYVVHEHTLYILAFWPARSGNQAAADQMEVLYATITGTWAWSPCTASE